MEIRIVESLAEASAAADVLGLVATGDAGRQGDVKDFEESLGGNFSRALERKGFEGQVGQYVGFDTGLAKPSKVVVLGVGAEPTEEALRRAGGLLGRAANNDRSAALAGNLEKGAAAAVEGFLLAQYSYDRFKSDPKPSKTEGLIVQGDLDEGELRRARVVTQAVCWARDLINTPALNKAPTAICAEAEARLGKLGLRLKVHDAEDLEKGDFGGVLGVAAGSDRPPRMLEIHYEPEHYETFVALIGKGITFDSGGLSIKPAGAMTTMKTDMSGAAAVVATMGAVASLEIGVRVMALAPLSDNMPGPLAIKPGDVLTTRNGKTIEVLNTDAEGRLILADALAYAAEFEPDLMVDLATLTGACKVALGDSIAAIMGNDQSLIDRMKRVGDRAGEQLWQLPLAQEYRSALKTPMADMKNIGGRWGGAITAALILEEFVAERPWAHLDIAGPARWPRDEHYMVKGGSGFGVRTLVGLLEDLADEG